MKSKVLLNVGEMLKRDISLRQGFIMQRIGKGQASASDIREDGGFDKANMSASLKSMRKRKLLKIRPSEEDRRFSVLQLTEKGKELLKILSSR